MPEREKNQRREQEKVEREMPGKTEILADVAETAATDVEPARFRHDRDDEEENHERRENKRAAAIENPRDQGEPAENFQPRQIQGQPDTDLPRQHLVVADVARKGHRIECLDDSSVNEQSTNEEDRYQQGREYL